MRPSQSRLSPWESPRLESVRRRFLNKNGPEWHFFGLSFSHTESWQQRAQAPSDVSHLLKGHLLVHRDSSSNNEEGAGLPGFRGLEPGKHGQPRLQTQPSIQKHRCGLALPILHITTRHLHSPSQQTHQAATDIDITILPDDPTSCSPQNLAKMKFTVAAPLVALLTAFILALLTLLAGIKPNFMPDAYIGQYKPSPLPCLHLL